MTYQVLQCIHSDLDGYRKAIKEYTLKQWSHKVNKDGWQIYCDDCYQITDIT